MKSTGVVRKLDDLGRIVIPIELRRTMDIGLRDTLEIFVEDDKIILFFISELKYGLSLSKVIKEFHYSSFFGSSSPNFSSLAVNAIRLSAALNFNT